MNLIHRSIDYVAQQWNPAVISENWEPIDVFIRDNTGYCIKEGVDFQVSPKVFSLHRHKPTEDLYPQQTPLLGALTSALYLATVVPSKLVTCIGNAVHTAYKGNTPEGRGHLWQAAKDLCIFVAAAEIYRRSPAPLGIHLVHYIALGVIFATAISNPLGNRLWIHDLSRWDFPPIPEHKLRTMTRNELFWAALDGGSYSLRRMLGMERVGNREVDEKTIEPIETKAK